MTSAAPTAAAPDKPRAQKTRQTAGAVAAASGSAVPAVAAVPLPVLGGAPGDRKPFVALRQFGRARDGVTRKVTDPSCNRTRRGRAGAACLSIPRTRVNFGSRRCAGCARLQKAHMPFGPVCPNNRAAVAARAPPFPSQVALPLATSWSLLGRCDRRGPGLGDGGRRLPAGVCACNLMGRFLCVLPARFARSPIPIEATVRPLVCVSTRICWDTERVSSPSRGARRSPPTLMIPIQSRSSLMEVSYPPR